MVLNLGDDYLNAIEQSGVRRVEVTAFYGSDQTIPGPKYPTLTTVPITSDGSLEFSGSGQSQASGTINLRRDGDVSLVPKAFTDPLAPFGQEVVLRYHLEFGGQSWDVPLGRYRIKSVPKAQEYFRRFPSMAKVVGWEAELSITDLFDRFDDELDSPAPADGATSTWDEVARLSPIPIIRSLPDQPLPSGLTYQGRLDAIAQLLSNLGGEPHITREGALTARAKDGWLTATQAVATVRGTLTLSDGMSNALYNRVKVSNPNDATIIAVAQIDDPSNPLSVTSPLGPRTYAYSSPLMDTAAKAAKAAETVLARVSTQQSRSVEVTCLPRPDLELGDFIEVVDEVAGRKVRGEVAKMTFSNDATASMSLSLTVAGVA